MDFAGRSIIGESMGWLILGQAAGQAVTITVPPSDQPTEIRVSVSDWTESRVFIGYDAPKNVGIVRDNAVNKTERGDR